MLQWSHCFGSGDTCHFGSRCARYGHCAALILPLLLTCGWRCRPDPDHYLDLVMLKVLGDLQQGRVGQSDCEQVYDQYGADIWY